MRTVLHHEACKARKEPLKPHPSLGFALQCAPAGNGEELEGGGGEQRRRGLSLGVKKGLENRSPTRWLRLAAEHKLCSSRALRQHRGSREGSENFQSNLATEENNPIILD